MVGETQLKDWQGNNINPKGGGGTPSSMSASDVTVASGTGLTADNVQAALKELNDNINTPFGSSPKIDNPPYDLSKTGIKILDIGNSYTADQTDLIKGFINAAGNSVSDMCLYLAIRSGGTFKDWVDVYRGQGSANPKPYLWVGGNGQGISGDDSVIGSYFRDAIQNKSWDIIVIHQASQYSDDWQDWEGHGNAGYLQELVRIIRTYQPQATIAFSLVHVSPEKAGGADTATTQAFWAKVAQSTQWIAQHYGIDLIIPYGTAIENIRLSEFNTSSHALTRDNHHLGYGLAQYVAAACYYQTLFAPRFRTTVLENTYRYTVPQEKRNAVGATYDGDCIDVTDANAETAQMAAILACNNMYQIINPDGVTL